MKRFLMIIVLGLLWCNVSFADCRDDLDYEVTAEDAGGEKLFYVIYIIKNNSKNYIKIVETNIKTASKDIIIKRNENKLIKPFGATDIFHIRPLEGYNKDLAKYFGIICEYSTEKTYDEAPKKKETKRKYRIWIRKFNSTSVVGSYICTRIWYCNMDIGFKGKSYKY